MYSYYKYKLQKNMIILNEVPEPYRTQLRNDPEYTDAWETYEV